MESLALEPAAIRALTPADLGGVVAIDAAIEGRSRRAYIERRLQAARREPALHAQFAAVDQSGIAGYLLARVLEGEFGRGERGLRIELVGVRADRLGQGIGSRLFDALAKWSGRHAIGAMRTQASWRDHRMLGWLDRRGFSLAPAQVLECVVDTEAWSPERDDAMGSGDADDAVREIDFGRHDANDFERAGRGGADVRSMTAADLEGIVAIDRRVSGRDRSGYLRSRLAEALDDSTLRVSLAARREGVLAGFLMARADHGDFGRTEPVAVLDTIGVDPEQARHGVARALLSQLFANLTALRIERVETVVTPDDAALAAFLRAMGFVPSQRLAFVRPLENAA
ncbi:MAG: GNAT family N-acetyltransferase [Caldimonas sp.]